VDEQWRHECEVREWIRRRTEKGPEQGRSWLATVLESIGKKRGADAAERLRNDITNQWRLGNRGQFGDWR
jgi:hypothetical protein